MTSGARYDIERLLAEAVWARRLALHLAQDSQTADDLLQETWSRALERPPSAESDRASPRGWLARVMQNIAHSWRREEGRRRTREERASRAEAWSDEELADRVRMQRGLAQAVLDLDEPYRSAITLRYFEALSLREIALRQGVSYEAMRQRVSRALAMLRARLDREHGGDRAAWSALLVGVAMKGAPVAESGSILPGGLLVGAKAKLAVACGVMLLAALVWQAWNVWSAEPSRVSIASAASPVQPADRSSIERVNPEPSARESAPIATAAIAENPSDRELEFRGEVVDPAGAPVAGANVQVFQRDRSLPNLAPGEGRIQVAGQSTDAEGRFAIALEIGRSFDVDVVARGFAVERLTDRYAGEFVRISMHLASSIVGTVVNARDGSPIAGLRMLLVEGDSGRMPPRVAYRNTLTDSSGDYRFDELPAGRFLLEAMQTEQARTADTAYRILDVREEQVRADFELTVPVVRSTAALRGRVVHATTKAPIAGATVDAFYASRKTDANGVFLFEDVPSDQSFGLGAVASGFGRTHRQFEVPADGEFPGDIQLELQPARRARGRIVDEHSNPIERARVGAIGHGDRTDDLLWARSTADGSFEILDMDPRLEHALLVSKDGHGSLVYWFPRNESALETVDFGELVLRRMSLVRGRLVDESERPLAGMLMVLDGCNADVGRFTPSLKRELVSSFRSGLLREEGSRKVWTDDLGRFAFADLCAGEFTLDVRLNPLDRHSLLAERRTLTVGDGECVDDLRVVVSLALSIEGRVLDEHGQPVAEAGVSAECAALRHLGGVSTSTDAGGRFRLLTTTAGEYSIHVQPSGALRSADRGRKFAVNDFDGVQAGTRDLELVLAPTAWIRGRVVDSAGNGIENANLEAHDSGDPRRVASEAWTDPHGSFELAVIAGHVADLVVHPPEADGRFATRWTHPPITQAAVAAGGPEIVIQIASE